MPSTPICSSAPFTSSSTNGLTIAVTSFIGSALLACGDGLLRQLRRRQRGRAEATAGAEAGEVVPGLGVLALVDAGDLALVADAQAGDGLDDVGEDQADDERVGQHGERTHGLAPQLVDTAAVEQAVDAGRC